MKNFKFIEWKRVDVTSDTHKKKGVLLQFSVEDDVYVFELTNENIDFLRDALKKAKKLKNA